MCCLKLNGFAKKHLGALMISLTLMLFGLLQISWHLWVSRAPSTLTGSIWRWTLTEPRSIRSCLSLWSTRWSYERQAEWRGQPRDYVVPKYWHKLSPHPTLQKMHRHPLTHKQTHCQHCSQLLQAIVQNQWCFSRFGEDKEWCDSVWKREDPLMVNYICVSKPISRGL